jgi:hypothetical protein
VAIPELGDRREPVLVRELLARRAPLGFRQLEHGSPAKVAALRTFRSFEVLELVAARDAGGPAMQAFDD